MSHQRKATFWKTYLVGPLWCKNGSKMAVDIIALGIAHDTIWYHTEDDYFFEFTGHYFIMDKKIQEQEYSKHEMKTKKIVIVSMFDFEFSALGVPHS